MANTVEHSVIVDSNEDAAKPFARPSNTPEGLADLVSGLSNQQKAEMVYELVLFAALAAEETSHPALNEFLAELEDMAQVDADPERRQALRQTVEEALTTVQQTSAGEGRRTGS